jgi:hypothetical protein
MGVPLTSATVSSTYQALLKTSTNSTLASLSRISDGLGNDTNVWIGPTEFNNRGAGASPTNSAIGQSAFISNTTGSNNVAFGQTALGGNTTGSGNVGIGYFALSGITTQSQNVAVGSQAGGTGSANTAIGHRALNANVGGHNAALGHQAGQSSTGSSNIILGSLASASTFSECIVLGRNAEATANNQFVVGSDLYYAGNISFQTITPDTTWTVRINGANFKIPMLAI